MSGSVERQVKRQSKCDKQRREISRLPFYEMPVDAAKEERSIKMAHWPKKKKKTE